MMNRTHAVSAIPVALTAAPRPAPDAPLKPTPTERGVIDMPKRFRTQVGVLDTELVAIADLKVGDLIVIVHARPDVYRVTAECASHPRGWLTVWDMNMTNEEAAQRREMPGMNPDVNPRCQHVYPRGKTLYRVV